MGVTIIKDAAMRAPLLFLACSFMGVTIAGCSKKPSESDIKNKIAAHIGIDLRLQPTNLVWRYYPGKEWTLKCVVQPTDEITKWPAGQHFQKLTASEVDYEARLLDDVIRDCNHPFGLTTVATGQFAEFYRGHSLKRTAFVSCSRDPSTRISVIWIGGL